MLDTLWDGQVPSEPLDTAGGSPDLVFSLPVPLREAVAARAPGLRSTADVFRRLFEAARFSIKIFSPYVDPTFTGLAQAARAPIQIVTTLKEGPRRRASPVLERFAQMKSMQVRYLHESRARAQMFQLHAKMILADRDFAYIGSANLTDTSLHYNFELGVVIDDRGLIDRLHAVFDYVFDFAARPAGLGRR